MIRVGDTIMTFWQLVGWLLAYGLLYGGLALVGAGCGLAVIFAVTQAIS